MSSVALPPEALAAQPAGATVQVIKVRQPAPQASRRTWVLSPAVFLLAAGTTFLAFYIRTGSVTASTPRLSPLFDPRGASLQLRVETQGSGLRLSWNRYSPAVQAARIGMLEIDEGGQHREIALDRNQIVNGSVIYRPASDDVSFRLDLRDAQGSDVAQILRVLDASPRKLAPEPIIAANSGATIPAALRRKTETSTSPATIPPAQNSKHVENQPPQRAASPTSTPLNTPAAPVQVATITPPPLNSAATTPQPAADGETALTKPAAESQIRPPLPKPEPVRPNLQGASNSEPAPAREVQVAGYIPPRPLKWVKPDEHAMGGSNSGLPLDIKVKVKIDEMGHVTAAHALIDGGRRDKKLMAAAAAAVRQWVFEPAKNHGQNVASEETIVIHVGPEVP